MTTATQAQLDYIHSLQKEIQEFLAESGETIENTTAETVRERSVTVEWTEDAAMSAWAKENPARTFPSRAEFRAAQKAARPAVLAAEWERLAAKRRKYIAAAYAPTDGITKAEASAILDIIA